MHPSQLFVTLSFLPLLVLSHDTSFHKRRAAHPLIARSRRLTTTSATTSAGDPNGTTTTTTTTTSITAPAVTALATATRTAKSRSAATAAPVPATTNAAPGAIIVATEASFATSTLSTTYAPGATPPVKGAPPLPSYAGLLNDADWPVMDKLPTNLTSPLVAQYVAEVDMSLIPNIPVNGLNGCENATVNAAAIATAGADGNCWWTCGHCPDSCRSPPLHGPSPSTPKLLDYLSSKNLLATFFVVGSRALSSPDILQNMYMTGHQLSVHTWAHPSLTTISNEGIIAELAWSKAIIKTITGVTPNTFRPPYGDIDDRVRNIALQMGLQPVIWTTHGAVSFDTQDWEIPGGVVTPATVMKNFDTIINGSSTLDTGFIVLEHDLFEATVDLAVNKVLPQALAFSPTLTLEPIITCLGEPLSKAYMETFASTNGSGQALAQSGIGASTSAKPSSTGSAKASSGGHQFAVGLRVALLGVAVALLR